MSWMKTRQCCSGVSLCESGSRKYLSLPCRVWNHSRLVQSITTGPVRLRSASSRRWRMMISYGLSLSGGRSRSRVRSISAMGRRSLVLLVLLAAPVLRRVFELLEAAAAVDTQPFDPVRLRGDECRRLFRIGVEVLYDDALGAERQVEHVARLPRML